MIPVYIFEALSVTSFVISCLSLRYQVQRKKEIKNIQASFPGKGKICVKCHKRVVRYTPQPDGSVVCTNCK